MGDPTGINVPAVTAWLGSRLSWLGGPVSWERLAGGHSNLTYRVTEAGGRQFVFRRPPEGELLPGAHDMGREFKVMSALWGSGVPVPEPLAHCADPAVTGAPFYAMGSVEGRSLYNIDDVESLVPVDRRAALADSFIDTLAALHSLDPVEVGLGDLGRPDAYVARQLKRWYMSWTQTKTCERSDVDKLHDFLVDVVPSDYTPRVVHGDYGLHNCVSHPDGYVNAVVDWEISTLGDPLADLTYCMNAWESIGNGDLIRPQAPSSAPGFPNRQYLLERYCATTSATVEQLAPYSAFNHWKTVCIIDGVLARYLAGKKSTEGIDLDLLATGRDRSLEQAIARAGEVGYRS